MRQFLALELPGVERRELADLIERIGLPGDGWRWVGPAGLHLTLRFLGTVDQERDRRARSAWALAAGEERPLTLRLGAIGHFGGARRPRVLWIGVDAAAGSLDSLAARVERAAVRAGFAAEARPFRPHVTLARARRGARPRLPPPVRPGGRPFVVDALTLFRSDLGPDDARYTVLERYPLSKP